MSDAASVIKTIKDEEVEYVDLRFTDPRGKLQHVTAIVDVVDEDFLAEGFMFDGSSIAGWKSIDQSDMKLIVDTESAYVDPFYAEKTIAVHCSVVEPDTGAPYERCPRSTAARAASSPMQGQAIPPPRRCTPFYGRSTIKVCVNSIIRENIQGRHANSTRLDTTNLGTNAMDWSWI